MMSEGSQRVINVVPDKREICCAICEIRTTESRSILPGPFPRHSFREEGPANGAQSVLLLTCQVVRKSKKSFPIFVHVQWFKVSQCQ